MGDEHLITMGHGAGGELMDELINEIILPNFSRNVGEIPLGDLDDSAVIDGTVFTTDGHTVKPIFFPGGDLGSLAIAGTVNDTLALGGEPIAIAGALVIPEGKKMDDIREIIESAAETADEAGTRVVAGDTKVVEKEDLDEPILTTTGIGRRHPRLDENFEGLTRKTRWLSDNNLRSGDKIIVTGHIGNHGITILSERKGYGFRGDIKSDVSPLTDIMENALKVGGVVTAKDPTRGGLANSLNELAKKSGTGIEVEEAEIPIRGWVENAGEMLGIDPLTIGNEGKFVLGVEKEHAEDVLASIRRTEKGRHAEIIGEVTDDIDGVVLKTGVGGKRILETPVGDPVPRIC